MVLITDKPEKKKISTLTHIPTDLKEKVDHFFKTPLEKYKNPITSSHDYGWDKPSNLRVYKNIYPRTSMEITKFADNYKYSTGRSMFASNKVVEKK